MKKIITIFLFLISLAGFGQTNYYVKNGGNDGLTGLSDAQAWATLGKADDVTFVPGDTLFIARGSTFKEQFVPKGDGDATAQVVITAYGSGAKPIITARDTVNGWSDDGAWSRPWPATRPNVWYQAETRTPLYWTAFRMWINGIEEERPETFPPTADKPWYWHEDDSLFIYSTTNPGATFTSIEKGTSYYAGFDFDLDHYFTLQNIDLQHFYMCVRIDGADGIVIDSCNMTGYFGVNAFADAEIESRDCVIKNCNFNTGLTFNSGWEAYYTEDAIKVGSNCKNWDIYGNYFSDWAHASFVLESLQTDGRRIDSILFHDNYLTSVNIDYGGRIGADYYSGRGNKIYRNHIKDISIRNQFNGDSLEVFYNVFDGITSPSWRLGYGSAIAIQGYDARTTPSYMKFYNNTIMNCDDYGIDMTHYTGRRPKEHNEFVNNIFFNCGDYGVHIYTNSLDSGIYNNVFRNNIFFTSGVSDIIMYHNTAMTVGDFNNQNGFEGDVISGNLNTNPIFVTDTISLQLTSPAINEGLDVLLTADYLNNSIFGQPDIGAIEYQFPALPSTGIGFSPILYKQNIKDTLNVAKSLRLKGVPVLATANDINKLDGFTGTTPQLNHVTSLFVAGDTTVTAVVGKIVFQASDSSAYVCRSIVAPKKWYKMHD